jgi:hypothetical protein
LSIGAAEFNHSSIGQVFHRHIDVEDSVNHGLLIEPRTVMWWMEQDEKARLSITAKGDPLKAVLDDFVASFKWKNTKVWCNGASFDFPILKACFEAVDMGLPWAYYNEMDFRTIKGFFPKKTFDALKVSPKIAHNGLEDAIAQAKTLQNLMESDNVFELAA